ncbi:MAG: PAS domain-containing protein [Leptospiraceae bacterium]|nr:PAS domain-containing protein [Leptospiraceae bacterium]MBL0264245.1 PAS domain-containing protein [Leptospiraceae bacterium]MBP9165382.1 PAS domain-containing protein [Leptospiraceae bacterium]
MNFDEFPSTRIRKGENAVHNVEIGIIKENNELIWTEVSAVACSFPHWRVVIVTNDITERKKREIELQKEHSKLQAILDYSPALISIKDLDGNILLANRSFAVLDAPPLNEFIGKNVFDVFQKEVAEKLWSNDLAALENGSPVYSEEVVMHKDGNWHTYLTVKFPIFLQNNQPFGICAISNDITERIQNENKILQSLREKEILIKELYHRTRNTLQLIGGILRLQSADFQDNAELKKLVDETEKRIIAISLVHQMLYKKQNLSQISIKEYIHDLSVLIMESFNIANNRISLHVNIVEQSFLLDTAVPFGLIINELMTNSLKYGFPDNRSGNISINLILNDSGNYILQYSDNGVGISEGFDFRKQNTLGLKLIYSIAEIQMKGNILMESKEGITCTFEFPKTLYKARV